jgi:hypothetical protein
MTKFNPNTFAPLQWTATEKASSGEIICYVSAPFPGDDRAGISLCIDFVTLARVAAALTGTPPGWITYHGPKGWHSGFKRLY